VDTNESFMVNKSRHKKMITMMFASSSRVRYNEV